MKKTFQWNSLHSYVTLTFTIYIYIYTPINLVRMINVHEIKQ